MISNKTNGFLLVNKEIGFSSSEIVQKVKNKFSYKKVGHLGTLDPAAQGLLVLAVNRATKFSTYFLNSDKSYFVEIQLGVSTNTDDATGEVISNSEVKCSDSDVKKAVNDFLGESFQKPPYFSALKHKGKALYKYARQGQFIDKEPRKIEIKKIHNINYENKICSFELTCSKGTYIRSIARDLGKNLGCGGHMISLKRLSQNNFSVMDSEILENLSENQLISIENAFKEYKKFVLTNEELKVFQNGRKVRVKINSKNTVRVYSQLNDFIGLGEVSESNLKHKQLV
tara:strand:+ start:439 stop:1293 length:855 start_codon:yes stop_codon:yes gene_type:complete